MRTSILILIIATCCPAAATATRRVPTQYSTIQAAIEAQNSIYTFNVGGGGYCGLAICSCNDLHGNTPFDVLGNCLVVGQNGNISVDPGSAMRTAVPPATAWARIRPCSPKTPLQAAV